MKSHHTFFLFRTQLQKNRSFDKKYIPKKFDLRISQDSLIFENKLLNVPFYLIEEIPRLYRNLLKM